MEARELRGLDIAGRSKLTFKAGAWSVPSQSRVAGKKLEIIANLIASHISIR